MKVRFPFYVVGLLLCFFASVTTAQEKVDWDAVAKIRNEGFNNSKVMELAKVMTDELGPRLTGSPNLREAQRWARDTFTDWGLVNAALEEWGEFGRGWSNEYISAHMTTPRYLQLVAYPKAWTKGTNGKVSGTPMIVNISTFADMEQYKGKLSNKIILYATPRAVARGFDPDATRITEEQMKTMSETNIIPRRRGGRGGRNFPADRVRTNDLRKFFLDEGVAVALDPSFNGDDGTLSVLGGGSRRGGDPQAVAQVAVIPEHYNRIYRLIENGVNVSLDIEVRNTFYESDLREYNVVAEIPGTDLKDEVVMLGGHYDSWHAGSGATDNAAGSAVAMEAIRILKAIGVKPRRTIRVALWSGEEQGLLGSRAYVAKHFGSRNDPKSKYDKLAAYYQHDSGTGQIRGISVQGVERLYPIFTAWLEPFHDLGAKVVSGRVGGPSRGGSDHAAFQGAGLNGFSFTQDRIQYFNKTWHTNMDVYDSLIAEDLMKNAVITASFVYHTAMRDEMLPRRR